MVDRLWRRLWRSTFDTPAPLVLIMASPLERVLALYAGAQRDEERLAALLLLSKLATAASPAEDIEGPQDVVPPQPQEAPQAARTALDLQAIFSVVGTAFLMRLLRSPPAKDKHGDGALETRDVVVGDEWNLYHVVAVNVLAVLVTNAEVAQQPGLGALVPDLLQILQRGLSGLGTRLQGSLQNESSPSTGAGLFQGYSSFLETLSMVLTTIISSCKVPCGLLGQSSGIECVSCISDALVVLTDGPLIDSLLHLVVLLVRNNVFGATSGSQTSTTQSTTTTTASSPAGTSPSHQLHITAALTAVARTFVTREDTVKFHACSTLTALLESYHRSSSLPGPCDRPPVLNEDSVPKWSLDIATGVARLLSSRLGPSERMCAFRLAATCLRHLGPRWLLVEVGLPARQPKPSGPTMASLLGHDDNLSQDHDRTPSIEEITGVDSSHVDPSAPGTPGTPSLTTAPPTTTTTLLVFLAQLAAVEMRMTLEDRDVATMVAHRAVVVSCCAIVEAVVALMVAAVEETIILPASAILSLHRPLNDAFHAVAGMLETFGEEGIPRLSVSTPSDVSSSSVPAPVTCPIVQHGDILELLLATLPLLNTWVCEAGEEETNVQFTVLLPTILRLALALDEPVLVSVLLPSLDMLGEAEDLGAAWVEAGLPGALLTLLARHWLPNGPSTAVFGSCVIVVRMLAENVSVVASSPGVAAILPSFLSSAVAYLRSLASSSTGPGREEESELHEAIRDNLLPLCILLESGVSLGSKPSAVELAYLDLLAAGAPWLSTPPRRHSDVGCLWCLALPCLGAGRVGEGRIRVRSCLEAEGVLTAWARLLSGVNTLATPHKTVLRELLARLQ